MLNPVYQLAFEDLYQPAGLKKVYASFLTFLAKKKPRFVEYLSK